MHSSVASAAFIGLSCISSLAAGAPLVPRWWGKDSDNSSDFKFPLGNGFPNPSPTAVTGIQDQAHGTLPNGGAPSPISHEGVVNLRLIAFNEIFETAFFSQLLHNVTHNIGGYREEDFNGFTKQQIVDQLTATVAQEELHGLNANGALKANGIDTIGGCTYSFNVSSFQEAVATAATFTDVVLGTLQDVNQIFAQHGDDALVRGVSSVIGQEGEQDGFYRILQKGANKFANQLPFLTTSARNFAFTAILENIVPGSCGDKEMKQLNDDLHAFIPLKVETSPIAAQDQELEFSFSLMTPGSERYRQANVVKDLSLIYINQQNKPISEKITDVHVGEEKITFKAWFPFNENTMNGLTIAAVANGNNFSSADEVAMHTLIAPGLIEIN